MGFFSNLGVWHSTDGGLNWTNTTATLTTAAEFDDLVMDPTNPAVLYVGLQAGRTGGFTRGIYKTTNGGSTWLSVTTFFSNDTNVGRIALAIAPSSPSTIYASVANSQDYSLYAMLKSSNGGASWTQLVNTPNFLGGQGLYDNVLAVSATNPNLIYAGGVYSYDSSTPPGLIKSTDGGSSWTGIDRGIDGSGVHPDHHALAFDAAGNLLDGNDGGIFRTTNAGSTWQNLNTNLATIQFTSVAVDPNNPNDIIGGSQDNGTSKYVAGTGWTTIWQGDGGVAQIDPSNPQIVYASNFFKQGQYHLFRSDDGGQNFTGIMSGISTSDPVNFYAPYVIDPGNTSRLLFGSNRVYETTSRGNFWSPISPALSSGVIIAVGLAASDSNTIYAAYSSGSVFVTRNHGSTWANVTGTLSLNSAQLAAAWLPGEGDDGGEDEGGRPLQPAASGVGEILVDPNNAAVAYLVKDRFGGGHVFMTTTAGASWSDVSGNLPDLPTHAIALDPRGSQTLYVGTDQGVYRSTTGGQSWSLFGSGLPNAIVSNLVLSTSKSFLLAGTHGRGAWMISLSATSTSPQASLTGNGQPIADGSFFISTGNGTDFGSVAVGSSTSQTYVIANTGSGSLTVGTVSLGASTVFAVTNQPATTVAAGSSTSFTIRYSPSSAGFTSAIVSFTDNDTTQPNPFTFAIGGTGTDTAAPHIGVSGNAQTINDGSFLPSTANGTEFGSIAVGSFSFQTYTIANSGNAALSVGQVAITGTGAADFFVWSQPASTIVPGDSTSFTIIFQPSSAVRRDATVQFLDNDTSQFNPFTFAIGGTGTGTSAPHISLSGSGQPIADGSSTTSAANGTDFGSTDVGTSVFQTYTITNSGGATLSVGQVSISGSTDFSVVSQPDSTVSAGGSTSFTVQFRPSVTGPQAATVQFSDNDTSQFSPFNFVVGGIGTSSGPHVFAIIDDPQATFDPPSAWKIGAKGLNNNQHYASAGKGTSTATYVFSGLTPGQYNVLATWPANSLHATNVPYKIYDGGTPIAAAAVNQRPAPDGRLFPQFQQLLAVNIVSDTMTVVITNNATGGTIVADAIELVQGTTPSSAPLLGLSAVIQGQGGSGIPFAPGEKLYGTAKVGGPPLVAIFTIHNPGSSTLNLTGQPIVKVSGTNASDVKIIQPTQSSLDPGQTTTFQLSFSPRATGTRTAKFTIASNDPLIPQFIVNLSGTGTRTLAATGAASTSDSSVIQASAAALSNASNIQPKPPAQSSPVIAASLARQLDSRPPMKHLLPTAHAASSPSVRASAPRRGPGHGIMAGEEGATGHEGDKLYTLLAADVAAQQARAGRL